MTAEELLAAIADRLQTDVEDGIAPDEMRTVYLIAIRRMCPNCEARPQDDPVCIYNGDPHPWATNQLNGSGDD